MMVTDANYGFICSELYWNFLLLGLPYFYRPNLPETMLPHKTIYPISDNLGPYIDYHSFKI